MNSNLVSDATTSAQGVDMTEPATSTSSQNVSGSVQDVGASVQTSCALESGVDTTAHDTDMIEENNHMTLAEVGVSAQGTAMSVQSSSMNVRDVAMNVSDVLDDLDHEVGFVRDNTIGQKSKDVYMCGITRFVVWLYEHQASLLAAALCSQLNASSNASTTRVRQAIVRNFVNENPAVPPLDLDLLSPHDFERFLMSLRKASGEKPSKSLYGSLRSSLFHLFRRYDVSMPIEFASELTIFFKGLKRTVAHRNQASGTKMTEGKEPFDFSMYQSICKTMSVQCEKEFVFAHAFLVLSWNLMCRAGNAVSIRFEHVKWYQDAMAIRFGHMKNDQDGERQRDPRHIYANPLVPEICPVLSLAVYFSIFGFDSSSRMFPGGNQYDRYSKVLKRAMRLSPTKEIMESNGFTPTDFGSHSARKGSATFVSSCTTAGPSASSICLRAGWSLPGVQDTYVRYEAAGDRVVGRFVAGLPFETSQFAILPPFFPEPGADVDQGCSLCFPSAPVHMKSMCSFMLASLVYHYDYLESSLPRNHLLFSSPLFREVNILMTLRHRVACRCALRGDSLRPTGLPPHIGVLVSMDAMTDRFESVVSSIEQIVPAVSREFRSVANSLNDSRGFVSSDSIDRAVATAIDRSGLNDVVEMLRQHVHPSANTVDTAHQSASGHDNVPTALVGQSEQQYAAGELSTQWWSHELPANFSFPKVTVAQAWELWLFGSVRHQYPPFRRIQPGDLPTVSTRKRLSDFRYVMKAIEQAVREDGTLNSIHTLNQARHRLGNAIGRLHILDRTAKNYTRRREQLQWSTVVNLLRKSSKDSCVSRS